jgi:hypothetical protein
LHPSPDCRRRTQAGGIYWTDRGNDRVERALYDGAGRATVLASAGTNVRGLFIDQANNRIFYADNGADKIYRMNLDGSNRTQVLSTGSGSSSSPPMWNSTSLRDIWYYCDQQLAHIRRINLDGSNPVTLVTDSTYQPYFLDLDLVNGKIYWGDFDGVSANTRQRPFV